MFLFIFQAVFLFINVTDYVMLGQFGKYVFCVYVKWIFISKKFAVIFDIFYIFCYPGKRLNMSFPKIEISNKR